MGRDVRHFNRRARSILGSNLRNAGPNSSMRRRFALDQDLGDRRAGFLGKTVDRSGMSESQAQSHSPAGLPTTPGVSFPVAGRVRSSLGHKSVSAFAKHLQTRVGDRRVILDTSATLNFLQRNVDA